MIIGAENGAAEDGSSSGIPQQLRPADKCRSGNFISQPAAGWPLPGTTPMSHRSPDHRFVLLFLLLFAVLGAAPAQTGPTATPQQAPRTAPQVQETLSSYEG